MAVTLLNSSGYTWGIPSNEVGLKAGTFTQDHEPEFREPRLGLQNAIEGWAIGPVQRTVTITGEVNNTTGVIASTPYVAFVPVNTQTFFGGGTGGFYLTNASINIDRGAWLSTTATYQSNEGVT